MERGQNRAYGGRSIKFAIATMCAKYASVLLSFVTEDLRWFLVDVCSGKDKMSAAPGGLKHVATEPAQIGGKPTETLEPSIRHPMVVTRCYSVSLEASMGPPASLSVVEDLRWFLVDVCSGKDKMSAAPGGLKHVATEPAQIGGKPMKLAVSRPFHKLVKAFGSLSNIPAAHNAISKCLESSTFQRRSSQSLEHSISHRCGFGVPRIFHLLATLLLSS
ncbi:unnamed protein product [Plutella xylostella]|uniref:(diamondback moth) hypothetical protein n=1 Tax=Plutella xylostella TaxID=51655 RepID=A0A8S4FT21_PLUXY|nr:unnamed protein product [Plutella xylostella]